MRCWVVIPNDDKKIDVSAWVPPQRSILDPLPSADSVPAGHWIEVKLSDTKPQHFIRLQSLDVER